MKKLVLLICLLLINLISAAEINLSKEDYFPQETLQAEITGNFIEPITTDNIFLYKEGIPRPTPVIYDITRYLDTYYLYMVLPNQNGNFTIKIEDIRYTEKGEEKNELIKQFKIKKTNDSYLQINPGFIKTTKDFSIKIKALSNNQDISLLFPNQSKSLTLTEESEKTVEFSVSNLTTGRYDLEINDYIIPVFVAEKEIIEDQANDTINQTFSETINDTEEKNESLQQNKSEEKKISEEELEVLTEEEIKALHCEDFGVKCKRDEKCDGKTKESLEGPCCVGKCVKKDKKYLWAGVILILIVSAILAFLYFKSKKKKPPSAEEILKKKQERFEKRMSGEVLGHLGKI